MKKGRWKKFFKIFGIVLLSLLLVLIILFYRFIQPKTNAQIIEKFSKEKFHPTIQYVNYQNKKIRVIAMQEAIDTMLPTLVFVHGSPGSSLDFKKYFTDTNFHQKANIIAYDRIGYGVENTGDVLNSVPLELDALRKVIGNIKMEKIILIGYSYGATIVMAAKDNYKYKIALAPAIKGDLEPMFWALNLYKWKTSRAIIPKIFQAASKEKIKHVTELPTLEKQWNQSGSKVTVIHGTSDGIVPYANSLFLQKIIDKDKFRLVPIEDGTHALVWTDFELIKNEILKTL